MNTFINLLDFKEWLQNVWEKIVEEFLDLIKDFADVFSIIKEHTYDVLCRQFGDMVVNLFGITLIFVIIMLVATKIINK